MHYILESIFIGFYYLICYAIISTFFQNVYGAIFLSGFFKHFLGFYIGLHDYYCQHGDACLRPSYKMQGIFSDDENLGHPRKYFAKKNTAKLFITSIIEGFVFVFLAYLFSLFINNKWILVFVLGSVIHIMSEWIGIHKAFCLEDCGLLNT